MNRASVLRDINRMCRRGRDTVSLRGKKKKKNTSQAQHSMFRRDLKVTQLYREE